MPHRQSSPSQCRTIQYQLGIQQDTAHHKGRQPVVPHSLPGKRRRDRNRPVHAQRRCHSQKAGRDNSPDPHLFIPQPAEQTVNSILCKDRNQRTGHHAQYPVKENLAKLNHKIITNINDFSLHDVRNTFLSDRFCLWSSPVMFYSSIETSS